MVIPAITMAGCCGDGFSFIGGHPLVERAYLTPVKEFAFSATLPDAGFRTGDGGFDAGLLWAPSIGVNTGIGSKVDLTLSTPMQLGGTIFLKYGLGSGSNPLAAGLKLSGSGFGLPGVNTNLTDTSYRGSRGQMYVTPLFMMDSKPGGLQYTFDVGPVIEYSKGQYGHGYSLDVAAEYDLFSTPFWSGGPIGAFYVAGAWRPWSNSAYVKTYQPPVSLSLGVSFEEIAHIGTKW
jgi:hypothetical protein